MTNTTDEHPAPADDVLDDDETGEDDGGTTPVNVYRDGFVHVRAERCAHCLLSKDRIVPGDRARELITETRDTDGSTFVCHRNQVSDEPEAICAGWYEKFGSADAVLRLAEASNVIKRV